MSAGHTRQRVPSRHTKNNTTNYCDYVKTCGIITAPPASIPSLLLCLPVNLLLLTTRHYRHGDKRKLCNACRVVLMWGRDRMFQGTAESESDFLLLHYMLIAVLLYFLVDLSEGPIFKVFLIMSGP